MSRAQKPVLLWVFPIQFHLFHLTQILVVDPSSNFTSTKFKSYAKSDVLRMSRNLESEALKTNEQLETFISFNIGNVENHRTVRICTLKFVCYVDLCCSLVSMQNCARNGQTRYSKHMTENKTVDTPSSPKGSDIFSTATSFVKTFTQGSRRNLFELVTPNKT